MRVWGVSGFQGLGFEGYRVFGLRVIGFKVEGLGLNAEGLLWHAVEAVKVMEEISVECPHRQKMRD